MAYNGTSAWALDGPNLGSGNGLGYYPSMGPGSIAAPNYSPSYQSAASQLPAYPSYTQTPLFTQNQLNQNVNQSNAQTPSYLQISPNYGQAQYNQGVSLYNKQTLLPQIAALQSQQQVNGQNDSTFGAAALSDLTQQGGVYAQQAGMQYQNNAINNLLNERGSYYGAPTQNYQQTYDTQAQGANAYGQNYSNYGLNQAQQMDQYGLGVGSYGLNAAGGVNSANQANNQLGYSYASLNRQYPSWANAVGAGQQLATTAYNLFNP